MIGRSVRFFNFEVCTAQIKYVNKYVSRFWTVPHVSAHDEVDAQGQVVLEDGDAVQEVGWEECKDYDYAMAV